MTLLTSVGFHLDRIARETVIILIDNLNTEIANQEAAYTQLDQNLADKRGVAYEPVILEKIDLPNFHLGHKPSLINAPIDGYPNICVMAANAAPSGEENDHYTAYEVELGIEVMCKARGEEALEMEELVNRRLTRTIDAIHGVMTDHQTLNGLVTEFAFPASAATSEVFLRQENTAYGQMWCWQGGRVEYLVSKPSAN